VLALVHQLGQFGPARSQLVGDAAPCLAGLGSVGLIEGLADRGSNDGVLAARDVGQGVAHPVDAAALPGGLEDAIDGRAQAAVGIRDDRPGAVEPADLEAAQKIHPRAVSASDGPSPRPMISRRPSVFADTAIMAATPTIRPPWRSLRQVASSRTQGHSSPLGNCPQSPPGSG